MKRLCTAIVSTGLFFGLAAPAWAAAVFNPNLILSDTEIRDFNAMDFPSIAVFLHEKGGFGNRFDVDPIDGLLKSTAQLVDDAAKRYRINPKYILALIQKESGAVETPEPTERQLEWAVGYALCDGCSRHSGLAAKYRGLGKQIDVGAGWMDWYMANVDDLDHMIQPGETHTISSTSVTPANLTTAALYNYTPHLHGNKLLWSIWNRWFGNGLGLQFPDGSLVRNTDSGAVALIQGNRFRPITTASVLETRFRSANIIDLDQYAFAALEESLPAGRPVRFPDLSLVRVEDGTIFLLKGAIRRRIVSPEVFAQIGFHPEEVEDAAAADLADYSEGQPITLDSAFPTGQLIQDSASGGVYYVEAGVKHPLWDKAFLQANYSGLKLLPLPPEELADHPTGPPVVFQDGTLVKAPDSATVYVISNGHKRPIPSETVFLAYGYSWNRILTASHRALALHPTGDPLVLLDTEEVEPA